MTRCYNCLHNKMCKYKDKLIKLQPKLDALAAEYKDVAPEVSLEIKCNNFLEYDSDIHPKIKIPTFGNPLITGINTNPLISNE